MNSTLSSTLEKELNLAVKIELLEDDLDEFEDLDKLKQLEFSSIKVLHFAKCEGE